MWLSTNSVHFSVQMFSNNKQKKKRKETISVLKEVMREKWRSLQEEKKW